MLPIAIMRMGSGAKVKLINGDTVTAVAIHPSAATASIFVENNGFVVGTDSGGYQWLKGSTNYSGYEINATLNSGLMSGTFGSWLNLGTTQSWSLTRNTIGTNAGSITLQIRPVGGSVLATATITFSAEVD